MPNSEIRPKKLAVSGFESYKVRILSVTDNPPGLKKIRFEAWINGSKVELSCLATKSGLKSAMRSAILDHIRLTKENAEFAPKEFTV